jgi:predicted dehydrogenase
MNKVRIGFVGVGNMGQCAHLKNYAIIPDCEVVAIAELREELGRKVAARYGVPKVYRSHEELLANEQLDAIVSAQPFTRHGLLLPELAKAGLPILTEKPLAGSIESGKKVIAALEASGTWHMLGYHKRSDPATMYAKAEIDRLKQTGELGKLKYVRILMPAGDWIAGGFNDLISAEGGRIALEMDPPASDMDAKTYDEYIAFVNYYIHQVNLMRHLLGENYTVSYADPNQVLFVAETTSGVTGTIEMSPYTNTIRWDESVLVAFEHGFIKIDLPAPVSSNRPGRVEIMRDPGKDTVPTTLVPDLPWVHAMRQQAINFCRAVRGEIPPMTEAHEALQDLQIARDYIRLLRGV